MSSGFDEALDPEFRVTPQSENLDLYGVHQRVEQGAIRDFLIEGNDIEERDRIHVRDLGWLKAKSASLGKELGNGNPCAAQLDETDLIEQCRRKIRPHPTLLLSLE